MPQLDPDTAVASAAPATTWGVAPRLAPYWRDDEESLPSGGESLVALLGFRAYDPTVGRFTSQDTYLAGPGNTIDSNLYAYVGGNPVNHTDPSGKWTLTSATVTGGIIGGIVGFTYGAYRGAQASGKILSWKTLQYGALGLVIGAGVGALAGAAIYGAGAGLAKLAATAGTRSWAFNLIVAAHGTRLPAFELGVMAGITMGVFTPNEANNVMTLGGVGAEGALSATLYAYNHTVGKTWNLYPHAREYFRTTLFNNWAGKSVKGSGLVRGATFWAAWFFAGFTVGYLTTKAITWSTDEAIDWLERADMANAESMSEDLKALANAEVTA